MLRYEGRRQVPWKTLDVAAIFGLYFLPLLAGLAVLAFEAAQGERAPAAEAPEDVQSEEADTHHAAIDLLRQDGSVLTWTLCIVAAVIVAPVAEEFLFRLVLQGWLEARQRSRRGRALRLLAPGACPILTSSFLFWNCQLYPLTVMTVEPAGPH